MTYSKGSSTSRRLCGRITDAVRVWSKPASNPTFPISGVTWIQARKHIRCLGWRPTRTWLAAGALAASTGLAACSAPTEVIDLSVTPPATLDAMSRVPILPLGSPGPSGLTSAGPILGFGCGQTASEAASAAVRQLQIKALNMQAVAVMDVLVTPAGSAPCSWDYGATASGTALATRHPSGLW
jgi:hypothetical protein